MSRRREDEVRSAAAAGRRRRSARRINGSGFFRGIDVRRYLWDVSYTADEYIAVLNTYSGHRALDDATRGRLYDRIRRRVEARPKGAVRKTYLATLDVAQRL